MRYGVVVLFLAILITFSVHSSKGRGYSEVLVLDLSVDQLLLVLHVLLFEGFQLFLEVQAAALALLGEVHMVD